MKKREQFPLFIFVLKKHTVHLTEKARESLFHLEANQLLVTTDAEHHVEKNLEELMPEVSGKERQG